jgi:hypothetical protein
MVISRSGAMGDRAARHGAELLKFIAFLLPFVVILNPKFVLVG